MKKLLFIAVALLFACKKDTPAPITTQTITTQFVCKDSIIETGTTTANGTKNRFKGTWLIEKDPKGRISKSYYLSSPAINGGYNLYEYPDISTQKVSEYNIQDTISMNYIFNGTVTVTIFNEMKNPIKITQTGGAVSMETQYTYDAKDSLTKIAIYQPIGQFFDSLVFHYTTNQDQTVTSTSRWFYSWGVPSPIDTTIFTLNASNQVTKSDLTSNGLIVSSEIFEYAGSLLVKRKSSSGEEIFFYDSSGRILKEIKTMGTDTTNIKYIYCH